MTKLCQRVVKDVLLTVDLIGEFRLPCSLNFDDENLQNHQRLAGDFEQFSIIFIDDFDKKLY